MHRAALFIAATAAFIVGSTPAYASKNEVLVRPNYDNPAPLGTLENEFGNVSFRVSCPTVPPGSDEFAVADLSSGRRVEVTVANNSDAYREPPISAGLIVAAQARALADCPITYTGVAGDIYTYPYGGSIKVYRRTVSPSTLLLEMGAIRVSGYDLTWDRWAEHEADRADKEAADAQERQAQAESEAQRQARANAEAQRIASAQQQQEAAARAAEASNRFFSSLWSWIKIAILIGIAAWVWSRREAIMEWYYSLSPHPAQALVDNAIYRGAPIDGDLYAQIHAPEFGSRAENVVRIRQASELVRRLRERTERENAFTRAHMELLRAGVDHEVAAASVDELRRTKHRDDS